MGTVKRLSELMSETNIDLEKANKLICCGKIDNKGKSGIKLIALTDEFENEEGGDKRKTTKAGLKLRIKRALSASSNS